MCLFVFGLAWYFSFLAFLTQAFEQRRRMKTKLDSINPAHS